VSGEVTVLERLSRVTPLGLRFWDEAAHAVVTDGLVVDVYPASQPQRRTSAFPNRSGTFVVTQLPGPRVPSEEFGEGDRAFWSSVRPRPFVIEVSDRRGYYQPFTLDLLLPNMGLATPPFVTPASPPSEVIPLFPTASRPVPAGAAIVRAELQTPVPRPNGSVGRGPASWALLEVQVGTAPPVRGVADHEGRVAVLLPYPEPTASPARPTSPPYPAGTSLQEQEWPVRLTVFFESATPTPDILVLRRTLEQRPAMAWIEDAGGTRPLGDQVLRYGQELIVRSVVVASAGSPP
jgi:hypothetical protein